MAGSITSKLLEQIAFGCLHYLQNELDDVKFKDLSEITENTLQFGIDHYQPDIDDCSLSHFCEKAAIKLASKIRDIDRRSFVELPVYDYPDIKMYRVTEKYAGISMRISESRDIIHCEVGLNA